MTIGIAAFGPGAGRAILAGLAVAERVGGGAIGGFVSFAALPASGGLARAATQTGGGAVLDRLDPAALEAPVAALMSSGANRPEPLAQFVAGAAGIGLVTGHRFPNMPGVSGVPLNEMVLARMASGEAPAIAVAATVAANPQADAGLIAIDPAGALGSGDTRRLERLADRNSARLGSRRAGALVAVRHNGIHPSRGLAQMVAEVTLAAMQRQGAACWVEFQAGVPVIAAAADRIVVDARRRVVRLEVSDRLGAGLRHLGMGSAVPVVHGRDSLGVTLYEPFLTVCDGALVSIDGQARLRVPFAPRSDSQRTGNG
ncbi:MAG TPA: hypothetical protein VME92_03425 [Acetobacteraceae bacterium]|nr:hypothetical protein [Acetobacteraceae bacterium]